MSAHSPPPTPTRSPPQAPPSDPDAPLNLSKPKGETGSPPHADLSPPLAATAPKLHPGPHPGGHPGPQFMHRPFLPYAGLAPNHQQHGEKVLPSIFLNYKIVSAFISLSLQFQHYRIFGRYAIYTAYSSPSKHLEFPAYMYFFTHVLIHPKIRIPIGFLHFVDRI